MPKHKKPQSIEEEVKKRWKHVIKFIIKDEDHLLFAAFIVALLAIVIINTTYVVNRFGNNALKSSSTSIVALPTKVLTSQQQAVSNAYNIQISSVTENDKLDPAFTLDPNETMLIMNISITNKTSSTQNFVPVQQLYIRSRDGDYANMHPSIYVTNPIQATDLAPGKTVTGQISFNIPKSQASPLLYVDLGWDNYVPVVFDVMK